jgi:uncharacterized membrane protein
MKKTLIALGILLSLGVATYSVISSYGSVTGYATVNKAIKIDIIGSSNDDNYTLSDVHQGETKWSPKIKLINEADVSLNISIGIFILSGSAGNESDVNLTLWNENKNETLHLPIEIKDNLYFYVKHDFYPNASPGNYSFSISVNPV